MDDAALRVAKADKKMELSSISDSNKYGLLSAQMDGDNKDTFGFSL